MLYGASINLDQKNAPVAHFFIYLTKKDGLASFALGQYFPQFVAHFPQGRLSFSPANAAVSDGDTVFQIAQVRGNALFAGL